MPRRSQRHQRDFYGVDSAGEADPGVTAAHDPTSHVALEDGGSYPHVVTLTKADGNPLPGAVVYAASANAAVFTVSPASAGTDSLGQATFSIDTQGLGTANATFTSNTDATIANVSVNVA